MSANLFVYGTLRRGSHNRFARFLAAHARFLGDARIAGRLYNLGRYPGATRSDALREWVRGEVFRLDQPAKTLSTLDAYEGPRFERSMARVHLASGIQLDAWVYFCAKSPPGPAMVSGAWPRRA